MNSLTWRGSDSFIEIVHATPWFMQALRAVRQLNLASWCIGAGAVRNMVWDALHGWPQSHASHLSDVDVAYFDDTCLSPEQDAKLEQQLCEMLPVVPWEVTNQAAVHTWFEAHFGHAVEPLHSLEEATATWPEYATSVGIVLGPDDEIDVIAPHGLDDLLGMVVRRNPKRVSQATYKQRVEQKCYLQRWPRVVIVE